MPKTITKKTRRTVKAGARGTASARKNSVSKNTKKPTRPGKNNKSKNTTAKAGRTSSAAELAKPLVPRLELEEYQVAAKNHKGVRDEHTGSIKFAWLGSGQCGGRIIKTFYNLGYRKTLAVNTTHLDLDTLDLPRHHKLLMDIGTSGAGKDMKRGAEAVNLYKQQVLHNTEKIFGSDIDHVMVCFGAGGGTGSGSARGLIELAKNYVRRLGFTNPERSVGAMMTLPTIGEAKSPKIAANAYTVAAELAELSAMGKISPLIIIDNAKISTMYPGLTVRDFWPTINRTVGVLFDVFNRLSSLPSQYTSFDHADYYSIISAGGCAIMGLTRVDSLIDRFSISAAVRDNLAKTLLADGFDLKTARLAGSVFVGGQKQFRDVPGLADNINYAFDVLADVTGDATVHRGIYEDTREALRVYTIIGGLEAPMRRINQLKT